MKNTVAKKIIAIGGGEIGRAGYSVETAAIDKEIIRLTGKKCPRLLFLPTASGDSEGYCQDMRRYFGDGLGCDVDVLYLIREKMPLTQIKAKIFKADIVYVGGGNTLRMMKIWRKLGVDQILREAHSQGKVMSGVSAGAICWFRLGSSDSRKAKNPDAPYIKVRGLDLVNALVCPHYDVESNRKADLKSMMKKTSGVAIAIDNRCAIEIIDGNYRILSSKDSANAYKICAENGQYLEEKIPRVPRYSKLIELLETK